MSGVKRVFVEKKKPFAVNAKELLEEIGGYLGIKTITDVRVLIRYDIENLSEETYKKALTTVFSEPPVDDVYEGTFPAGNDDFVFSVEYLPGQFDQRADSAEQCVKFLNEDEEPVTEEDLQAAEAEFLNGPSGVQKHSAEENADESVTVAEDEVPLEEEEEYSGDDFTSGEDQEDDNFVSDMVYDEDQDDDEELSEEEQIEKFIETIQPEKDQNKIISRKRLLTDEEKQLFTYFVAVPGMKEQLLDVLCDVQKGAADRTSRTGNVIVMGGRETGKTRLISSLIPAICKELNIEASKVAYIFAEDLNGKDIEEIAAKLAGGFLVIENANQLSQETAAELEEVMNGNTKGMIVILEDEKIGMRKLIARYPKLAKKFTSMINIPVFTNDELVNFAKVYTMENGFRIDQMGMLALYNLIGINQKEDQPMCIGTVKKMLDDAMTRAQSGLFKRSKKRVDRDGYTVLLEKDFS